MKNEKKLIFCAIVISVFGTIAGLATGALPPTLVVTPSSPTALSTISIAVTHSGTTPSQIRVTVEECNGDTGICYPDIQNVSMSLISGTTYRSNVTLRHADATYITCKVITKTDGTWTTYEQKNVTLSENTNGNNGDNGDKSPGFEAILFIVAVCIGLIIIGRKRVK